MEVSAQQKVYLEPSWFLRAADPIPLIQTPDLGEVRRVVAVCRWMPLTDQLCPAHNF